MLDAESLRAFLDNFTVDDLRDADLRGVDLSGVRWSPYTTRWPSDLDVEELRSRSDETPCGSGIWVVRSGAAGARDHAGL